MVDADTPVEVVPEEDGSAVVSEEAMNDAISSAVAEGNPQVTFDQDACAPLRKRLPVRM